MSGDAASTTSTRTAVKAEIEQALKGMFTITHFEAKDIQGSSYVVLFAKPSRRIRDGLFIDREVLILSALYSDIQAKTIQAVRRVVNENSPRLFPTYAIVVHSDPSGNSALRKWGREENISILPLYRPSSGLPKASEIETSLSRDIHSIDPFDVSVAVVDDREFYGRREEALSLARQLEAGQARSLFGIRKVGKTSVLDRVVKIGRETETFACAVADCSKEFLWSKHGADALGLLKGVLAAAVDSDDGYAVLDDRQTWGTRSDDELIRLIKAKKRPVVWLLDEIDYLTPSSPTNPATWAVDFNALWRELRAFYQEAHRQGCRLGLLVCGVSSKWFRAETVNGIENAALTLVPEAYLSPFGRFISEPMLRDLGKRCGLRLTQDAARAMAECCGDFPFWMRKAGSFLHRSISVDQRPIEITESMVSGVLQEFIRGEGGEIAATSLRHLLRQMPELRESLEDISKGKPGRPTDRRILAKYGILSEEADSSQALFPLLQHATRIVLEDNALAPEQQKTVLVPSPATSLGTQEWAEELSAINRRRNIIEKKLRGMVVNFLQVATYNKQIILTCRAAILQCVDEKRRLHLEPLETDSIADKLYWLELVSIVSKNWVVFERLFNDVTQFKETMLVVNLRPDAHAKNVDQIDIARQREALLWLENKLRF